MLKKMTALLLSSALLMGQMTFAAELSKLEYTKQLVKGLGFEVKSAEEAYNRKTSESEDIIYTAFQMGLLNGVSWDFENPMKEEEREIILGNAMEIHDKSKSNKEEKDTPIDESTQVQNKENMEEQVEEQVDESEYDQVVYEDFDYWTDEEYLEFMSEWTNYNQLLGGADYVGNGHYKYTIFKSMEEIFPDLSSEEIDIIENKVDELAKVLLWMAKENGNYVDINSSGDRVNVVYAFNKTSYIRSDYIFRIIIDGQEEGWTIDGWRPSFIVETLNMFNYSELNEQFPGDGMGEYLVGINFLVEKYIDPLRAALEVLYGQEEGRRATTILTSEYRVMYADYTYIKSGRETIAGVDHLEWTDKASDRQQTFRNGFYANIEDVINLWRR